MSSTELPIHVLAGRLTCVFVGVFAKASILEVLRSTSADNTVVSSNEIRQNAVLGPHLPASIALATSQRLHLVMGSTKMFWRWSAAPSIQR